MSSSDQKKTYKYKRPKQKINPETSTLMGNGNAVESKPSGPLCTLLAKDSEWVDIIQTPTTDPDMLPTNVSDEEEVLQLVECEDGPQMEPLAVMFPGLLEKDPLMLQGMLNKATSTTEVTRHLVGLAQKANFAFMKKADRLIPRDKQWLESLTENSNSYCSSVSGFFNGGISSDYIYEFDNDEAEGEKLCISNVKTFASASSSRQNKYYQDSLVTIEPIVSSIVEEILSRVSSAAAQLAYPR